MSAKVYATYGIYNPDTAESIEEGETLDNLTYWNKGHKVTIENIIVVSINEEQVELETDNNDVVVIAVDDIEEWNKL